MSLSIDDPACRGAVRKFSRRMLPLPVFILVVNQMDDPRGGRGGGWPDRTGVPRPRPPPVG